VLVAARHVAPNSCTPRDKQTRFFERTKGKEKQKQKHPGFEFKPCHVNDSSQSNQVAVHLVSQYHNQALIKWLSQAPSKAKENFQ
jgi:hypothetical protein